MVGDPVVVVFLGPTMAAEEARAHMAARSRIEASVRPPARHGDVFRAARSGPAAIGLVDGFFDAVPSVWHKEILWALSAGVPVYGASSMGALRAAELHAFGMHGVGRVFEAFATGVLEDDDEVAVAHGGPAEGWRPLSDAMVDIRATLERAVDEGVVGPDCAAGLRDRLKAAFYADRSLAGHLDAAEPGHRRLRQWLPAGWVRQKHEDALCLLDRIAEDVTAGRRPDRPGWTLARTAHWEDARMALERGFDQSIPAAPEGPEVPSADGPTTERILSDLVLDEARLDPEGFAAVAGDAAAALSRRLVAEHAGLDRAPWADDAALTGLRRAEGLLSPADVDRWLAERDLDRDDLGWLAERARLARWLSTAHRHRYAVEVGRSVRTSPRYAQWRRRALEKRDVVPARHAAGTPHDAELIAWYFETMLGCPVPPDVDAWCRTGGWRDTAELVTAVRREWSFAGGAGETEP
jgi:hypothetical protein